MSMLIGMAIFGVGMLGYTLIKDMDEKESRREKLRKYY